MHHHNRSWSESPAGTRLIESRTGINQVVRVRQDYNQHLDKLFTLSISNQNLPGLPMRQRKLPLSFFQPPRELSSGTPSASASVASVAESASGSSPVNGPVVSGIAHQRPLAAAAAAAATTGAHQRTISFDLQELNWSHATIGSSAVSSTTSLLDLDLEADMARIRQNRKDIDRCRGPSTIFHTGHQQSPTSPAPLMHQMQPSMLANHDHLHEYRSPNGSNTQLSSSAYPSSTSGSGSGSASGSGSGSIFNSVSTPTLNYIHQQSSDHQHLQQQQQPAAHQQQQQQQSGPHQQQQQQSGPHHQQQQQHNQMQHNPMMQPMSNLELKPSFHHLRQTSVDSGLGRDAAWTGHSRRPNIHHAHYHSVNVMPGYCEAIEPAGGLPTLTPLEASNTFRSQSNLTTSMTPVANGTSYHQHQQQQQQMEPDIDTTLGIDNITPTLGDIDPQLSIEDYIQYGASEPL